MIRNLFLISVCLIALPSRSVAQNIDFSFPSDIFGFRFGDSRMTALHNCLDGENYDEHTFICHRTAISLGFDADVYVMFNSNNIVERVWIQSNPENNMVQCRTNYEILLDDLLNRFGSADYITSENEYHWIFDQLSEEGEISFRFYILDSSHGHFMLNFNANP